MFTTKLTTKDQEIGRIDFDKAYDQARDEDNGSGSSLLKFSLSALPDLPV